MAPSLKYWRKHKFERSNWKALKEAVKQDAYAQLLTELQCIQQEYKLLINIQDEHDLLNAFLLKAHNQYPRD